MKFVSFKVGPSVRYGVLQDKGVIDLSARLGSRYPTLRRLIAAPDWRRQTEQWLGAAPDHDYEQLELLSVVPDAGKVLCVALNYHDHIAEANRALPGGRQASAYPNTFIRFADSLVGHRQHLLRPRVSQQFDYEAELLVVMGANTPRYVSRQDALKYVFGYSVLNEGSLRDYQFHARQLTPGKNFYASGATGPYIVTADEVGDPQNLDIEFRLNGERLQHANTSDMIFSVADLIHYFAQWTPLGAGDLIGSGTMGGVGFTREPPIFMKPGDRAEVTIGGIGTLVNGVQDEA